MLRLYEHNRTAYEAAVSMLEKTGRAAVIHPTGTGKSFIGFQLCADNPDKEACWISPSEYIFRTQLENLKAAGGKEPGNIRFFTYAKLMQMGGEELDRIKPDLFILDEFHRAGAPYWGASVQRLLKQNPDVPVLGLSATAVRYLDGRRDMAQELFGGNVASEITLAEAVVRGILMPPKYVMAVYSIRNDLERYERRVRNLRGREQRRQAEEYLEALRRALENAEGLPEIFDKHMEERTGKYIVFCANKEHMDEMMGKAGEWFSKVDKNPRMYSVYSEDPKALQAFADFKADCDTSHLRLLFCIDALNEGIHVGDVSGVILLRPTVSPIIYKQQIGRALSAGGTKKPVIFDVVNNIAGLYSISAVEDEMREIVQNYRYLGEERNIVNESFQVIDELQDCRRLFEEFEASLSAPWEYMYGEAKRYYETYGDLLPPQNYVTEDGNRLGQWVVTQRKQYRGSREALAEEDRKITEKTEPKGSRKATVETEPTGTVTEAAEPAGTGKVTTGPGTEKGNSLTRERIRKLEAIGMNWQTLHERQWEEGCRLAEAYYEEHGDLVVRKEDFPRLSWWLIRQRQKYQEGQLTDEQYRRLDTLGMEWEPESSWEKKFAEAERYYTEHGNLDIPSTYVTENGTALGAWYRSVREQYRTGRLSPERIRRLETIGIDWEPVKERSWMQHYEAAKKYQETHGDLNVHAGYVTPEGIRLGVWISGQRCSYKKKRLTGEQIRLLEGIGMSWQRAECRWGSAYAEAQAYAERHGSLNPPAGYVADDGFALGAWVAAQRRKYNAGKLKEEQTEKLLKLGIVWNPADEAWKKGYDHARQYREGEKNLNVPAGYVAGDGFKLGSWLSNQRTRKRKGWMTREQREMLEGIGMRWAGSAAEIPDDKMIASGWSG